MFTSGTTPGGNVAVIDLAKSRYFLYLTCQTKKINNSKLKLNVYTEEEVTYIQTGGSTK